MLAVSSPGCAARAPGTGPLVLGIDAGASGVRAVLADTAGTVLGTGRAGGANPAALDHGAVTDHLCAAVAAALAAAPGADPARVSAAVLGVAGVSQATSGDGARAVGQAWQRCRLRCPVRVLPDPVIAFSAGTAARRGAVLAAGTGAIAAVIDDDEIISRVDGHGWLLGDDGSGFWLGRQAARAVLAELDGRGEPTMLRYSVLAALTGSDHREEAPARQRDLLRERAYAAPPVALAGLAPLVPAAAEAGDLAAWRIVDRAVELLVNATDTLLAAEPGASAEVLVVAGSVLISGGPIGRQVRQRITERHGLVPRVAGRAPGAAAWLAARQLGTELDPAAHERLTSPPLADVTPRS